MTPELKEAIEVLKFTREYTMLPKKTIDTIDTVIEAIEKPLPSDEKIEQYALKNILDDDSIQSMINMKGWIEGAIWMRDLIKKLGK